jgi:hypothetical protein
MAEGTRMQQRRATEAVWVTSDYVLAAGELGVTTDTGIIKVGNGTSPWTELDIAFGSEYLPTLGKAADSELLDGIGSESFVKVADTSVTATNDSYVKRTGDGGVKGSDATEATELTSLQQMTAAILDGKHLFLSRTLSANGTLDAGDANAFVYVANSSLTTQITVTVPPNSSVPFPIGTVVRVFSNDAGGAKILAGVGVTVNGPVNTMPGGGGVVLIKRATDSWRTLDINSGKRLPTIKYRRTAAGDDYSGYAFVPYDTLDSTETYNPDDEWYSIPGGSMPTARRIVVNKDGEYLFNASIAVDGSATTYCLLTQMVSNNSFTGAKIRASQSLVNVCAISQRIRVTAGQSFGVRHGAHADADGRADGEATGTDPVNFKITRLGD